jgi:hypothetical protein
VKSLIGVFGTYDGNMKMPVENVDVPRLLIARLITNRLVVSNAALRWLPVELACPLL